MQDLVIGQGEEKGSGWWGSGGGVLDDSQESDLTVCGPWCHQLSSAARRATQVLLPTLFTS